MEMGGADALARTVGGGVPQRIGSFRFYFAGERWEWSDEVARIHGYEPGSVRPTTELILGHKHPDDKSEVAAKVQRMLADGSPFSSRHRIIDTRGAVHHIIVIADKMFSDRGELIGSEGFYVDITDTIEAEVRTSLTDVLPEYTASREAIDRAKGVIMFVYGIPAQRAFEILKWRSQESNVKLREIAVQLLNDIESTGGDLIPRESRQQFDHILLTTHLRIGSGDAIDLI
ncbi:PAS and ANTAR domain-containing protein [Tsukamurella soli]|uniref:histidine kinase n=1 Tax=Tsukamurella soli TaxID=644556 RepID=A0ABP8J5T2_9ACTN